MMRGPPRTLDWKVKPDTNDYPIFRKDEDYPVWRDAITAVVLAHGLAILLQYNYVPPEQDIPTYHKMNYWLYMVLKNKIKTTIGRAIIARHKDSHSAVYVLCDLDEHYTNSTAGVLASNKILGELTNGQLTSAWNRSYSEYIHNWIEKAVTYNEICVEGAQLADIHLKTMLQRALHPIPVLRQVVNDEAQMMARGMPQLTYEQYCHLVSSASINHDGLISRSRSNINTLAAYDGSATGADDVPSDEASLILDINQAFARPRLPDHIFSTFEPEDRKKWISLTDSARMTIVKALDTPNQRTKVRLAEQVPTDDSPQDDGDAPSIQANVSDTSINKDAPSQAHHEALSEAHPGDPRRVLAKKSQQSKGKPIARVKATNVGMTYYGEHDQNDVDDTSVLVDQHDTPMFPDNMFPTDGATTSAYNVVSTTTSDYASDTDSSYDDDAWYAQSGLNF